VSVVSLLLMVVNETKTGSEVNSYHPPSLASMIPR
jgi:hypothetical protein